MQNFTSTEAKTRFGEFMEIGMKEGVCVTRNGRPAGYFVPADEYTQGMRGVGKPIEAPNGISETLAHYAIGSIPRQVAMKAIGTDDYGILLRLLNAAGFPHPQVKGAVLGRMARSFADVFTPQP